MVASSYGQDNGSIRGHVKNLTTGKSLYNAIVTIEETGQSTYTNSYGDYRFSGVASGSVTVTATYIGLKPNSVTVTVDQSEAVTGDIALYSNRSGLASEEVFELEAFTVEGNTYDSNVIALNEQRNSSNLKMVQHAEAFGEIAEGNIGEYVKNLPGVSVNYVAADVRSIKMRGMSPAFTQVTVDGAQMASAGSGNKIRSFELEQVSLANVELIEVSKLPRPDMWANAIGGSVNLVSKNAFAQEGRQLSYKLSFNFNDEESSLGATPGLTADKKHHKVLPGIELNYADVFMDQRLGIAMTYKKSNMFNIQQRFRWREWDLSPHDGEGDAKDAHFLRLQLQDGPKETERESFSSNVDFKIDDNTIFTFKGQVNFYDSTFFNRNVNWRIRALDDLPHRDGSTDSVSNNGYTFGEDRGVSYGGSFRSKFGNTFHVDFGMKHHLNKWDVDYGYTHSEATNHYADNDRGFLETWEGGARGDQEYIEFTQTDPAKAFSEIKVFDADFNLLPNRGLSLGEFELRRVRERPKESSDVISGFRVNARRNFTLGETHGYFQMGARTSRQERDGYQLELRYDYDGYNTDGERIWFSEVKDEVFSGHSPGFGYEGLDWPSIGQIHTIYNNDRSRWDLDGGRAVSRTIGTWFEMEEDIDALYAMAEFKFMDNKLNLLTGARYEKTTISGLQPVVSGENYVNNADDFGFVTAKANAEYSNIHPSVHLRYDATEKLVLRASYANTIGRPDFGDMFGPTTVNTPEFDNGLDPSDPDYELTDSLARGFVETNNAGLLPRESDNIDLTAEYYYDNTGVFSVSFFHNDMKNFIQNSIRGAVASDLDEYGLPQFILGTVPVTQADVDQWGLDSNTVGSSFIHDIETTRNVASATIKGAEINWKQDLKFNFFPEFLRGSSIYANGTFLSTAAQGDASPYANNFRDFAKETVNYGYLFNHGPIDFKFRWNIRGKEIGGTSRDYEVRGVEGEAALFRQERKSLDFDFSYKINDRGTIFVNARNLNGAPHRQGYYLPNADGTKHFILEREERFGTQWTVGVKGKF